MENQRQIRMWSLPKKNGLVREMQFKMNLVAVLGILMVEEVLMEEVTEDLSKDLATLINKMLHLLSCYTLKGIRNLIFLLSTGVLVLIHTTCPKVTRITFCSCEEG